MNERISKKGTKYFACEDYVNCKFISWELPLNEKCPTCGNHLTAKTLYGKLRKKCSNPDCKFVEFIQKEKVEEKNENS